MGRSRRRLRLYGIDDDGDGDGRGAGSVEVVSAEEEVMESLAPVYVPLRRDRPPMLAPVLELDGLDPFAEIPGPGLAADEAPGEDAVFSFEDPAQLELEPSAAGAAPRAPATPLPESGAAIPAAAEVDAQPAAVPPPPPDTVEALYAQAREADLGGRCDEAKRLYRQLLADRPAHVRARNNLAVLLESEGNHQGALAELDRALELDPDNGTMLVTRGALLGALGRFNAAERDLKKALRIEPAHSEALYHLGVVMSKKGLWGEAVPHLQHAVELEPKRAAAHYYLGEALNHVDDLAGALKSYQRAAELQPDNPRALYGLGIIYDRLARPDDAAVMYRRSREAARR